MKENYSAILEKFDLSPSSARVYLALLRSGKSTAIQIAENTGIYKANVYEALARLMGKGMATFIVEDGKKLYMPTNPEKLPSMIEESKKKTNETYDALAADLEKIMPDLLNNYKSIKGKDLFEVYKGRKGFKALITDILKEKPKYWKGFGNLQVQEFFPIDFTKWFKKTKFMLFSTHSQIFMRRLEEGRKTTRIEIKWLPADMHMPIVWTLFGNNLLILIYEPDIIGLRIKSDQIVNTFSSQFDYLWKKESASEH